MVATQAPEIDPDDPERSAVLKVSVFTPLTGRESFIVCEEGGLLCTFELPKSEYKLSVRGAACLEELRLGKLTVVDIESVGISEALGTVTEASKAIVISLPDVDAVKSLLLDKYGDARTAPVSILAQAEVDEEVGLDFKPIFRRFRLGDIPPLVGVAWEILLGTVVDSL